MVLIKRLRRYWATVAVLSVIILTTVMYCTVLKFHRGIDVVSKTMLEATLLSNISVILYFFNSCLHIHIVRKCTDSRLIKPTSSNIIEKGLYSYALLLGILITLFLFTSDTWTVGILMFYSLIMCFVITLIGTDVVFNIKRINTVVNNRYKKDTCVGFKNLNILIVPTVLILAACAKDRMVIQHDIHCQSNINYTLEQQKELSSELTLLSQSPEKYSMIITVIGDYRSIRKANEACVSEKNKLNTSQKNN